ncbi:MAG: tRNA 2-thiouridine(34) synthase MnmA [Patescibacteria group bacterium]
MKSQATPALNKGIKKRVFIGISGGVDSSVAAAMLLKAGYDVTGVFIKVWQPDWLECTWKEERRDAMRVAAHLGIPFVTLDLEKEYKRDVVDYMLSEYRAGRTPNPDVMCNKAVKFGGFYSWAIKQGADFVATGHYAEIKNGALYVSRDSNKDQSYFLWTLRPEQLKHILFPIGHLTKPEVRKLAGKFNLPTATKKDSQGICFIGMVDMKTFLSHYIEATEGNVLNSSGSIIGTHPGAVFFTIGERHGFTIKEKSPDDQPLYVLSKNMQNNIITVGERGDERTTKDASVVTTVPSIAISQTNWLGEVPSVGKVYRARSRYRQELVNMVFSKIDGEGSHAEVVFKNTQEVIAPGQSLVIYDGDICIGGGIIEG